MSAWLTPSPHVTINHLTFQSFGDTKFIPGLAKERFEAVLRSSPGHAAGHGAVIDALWAEIGDVVYRYRLRSGDWLLPDG